MNTIAMEPRCSSGFGRRILLKAGLGAMAVLALPSCNRGQRLQVAGQADWPGNAILFMAQGLGFLAEGPVELVAAADTRACAQALADGRAQAAVLPLTECLLLGCSGLELDIVLVLNASVGAHAVLAPPERMIGDGVPGKRIGYGNTLHDRLMLGQFLRFYGISPESIERVELAGDPLKSWHMRQLDALVTREPHVTRLLRSGAAKTLFSSRHVPDMMFDVLVVNREEARRHKQALDALLAAYFRALAHFHGNPMDAEHRIASRLGMRAEDIYQLFRGFHIPDAALNYAYLSQQQPHLQEAVQNQILLLQEFGSESIQIPELGRLLNPGFLPRSLL